MSDETGAAAPAAATSPGRLLREARERQGLHIAALAAAIKVAPKKLEALEADRFDALPDATFTRALAQTVCRALKTDPAPVMRLLPPPRGHRLETVGEGLNTPFRERPGVLVQSSWAESLASPGYWLAGLLLIGAIVVFFLPAGWLGSVGGGGRPASAPGAAAKVEPGMPPQPVAVADAARAASGAASAASAGAALAPAEPTTAVADAASAPDAVAGVETGAAASSPGDGEPPAGMVQLRTTAESWVEVTDGRGQPLVSRLLKPGEAVGLDGVAPFRVRIGNAAATELVFRGQPMDLKAFTRDNVARLELR